MREGHILGFRKQTWYQKQLRRGPLSNAITKLGISDGIYSMSASCMQTNSPSAHRNPSLIAAPLPWFTECDMSRTEPWLAAISFDPSEDPSSTTKICFSHGNCNDSTSESKRSSVGFSLYTGTMMLSFNDRGPVVMQAKLALFISCSD